MRPAEWNGAASLGSGAVWSRCFSASRCASSSFSLEASDYHRFSTAPPSPEPRRVEVRKDVDHGIEPSPGSPSPPRCGSFQNPGPPATTRFATDRPVAGVGLAARSPASNFPARRRAAPRRIYGRGSWHRSETFAPLSASMLQSRRVTLPSFTGAMAVARAGRSGALPDASL